MYAIILSGREARAWDELSSEELGTGGFRAFKTSLDSLRYEVPSVLDIYDLGCRKEDRVMRIYITTTLRNYETRTHLVFSRLKFRRRSPFHLAGNEC